MAKNLNRTETTHIDELGRTATCTMQWLLEKCNEKGSATHPITHNNKLTMFICGQAGFGDIAARVSESSCTVDLCCWGFDPGMELNRWGTQDWPRGKTFGDLLIDAGKRGVKVRLLVWHDAVGSLFAHNMPGYAHEIHPWYFRPDRAGASEISAEHSISLLKNIRRVPLKLAPYVRRQLSDFPVPAAEIPMLAREEYCHSWYHAAFGGMLDGIEVRIRSGDAGAVERSLSTEKFKAAGLKTGEFEAIGMKYVGTHHQKTILIDYAEDGGENAIGYVMGLNSVTDYWDTTTHSLDDPLRERGGETERKEHVQRWKGDAGYKTLKPFQDYACRIEGGGALIAVHENFMSAWSRASSKTGGVQRTTTLGNKPTAVPSAPPVALQRRAQPGDSTVQIVRTQPEEGDKTVRDAYWLATATAADAAGYLYIENQYFQSEEWAQHLLAARRNAVRRWREGSGKANKSLEHMPTMYVFIVTPVPERQGMVPRTHDALATLGQHVGMTGQNELIEHENKRPTGSVKDEFGVERAMPPDPAVVVQHANSIAKPNALKLESEFGLRICTAMLNTCAFDQGRWRYREIYIHSKLMIARDVFFMLGSANLNPRSLFVDSELNMGVVDPVQACDLRRKVWGLLSGETIDGGDGSRGRLKEAFNDWTRRMDQNKKQRDSDSASAKYRKMTGFLLPLEDDRKSLARLG
jgi:phosphatidylserine/phosphatidylglycerophosphate/cardiolipin synthase-like enzyme